MTSPSLLRDLGITLPIIQAPMAGSQGNALALAVSDAGGLGSLPCAMLTPDSLRSELRAITAQGKKPCNLNFFCHTAPEADTAREAAWRALLKPYYDEYGIASAHIPAGPARAPFSPAMAEVLEEFKPSVVSFHFGLPAPELLSRVKSQGAYVLSSATTVQEALWLQAHGADAIIAQGVEAGGHRGMFLTSDLGTQLGLMALLPQLVQALDVPVIAAGGITERSAVQAALRLGASAAQVGTAYLMCPEATTSAVHRAALISAQSDPAQHTALTQLFTGRPARGLVNRLMRELGPIHPAAPAFPLAASAIAPLRAKAEAQGKGDFSPLWSGQNFSHCKAIPAAQLTRELGDY